MSYSKVLIQRIIKIIKDLDINVKNISIDDFPFSLEPPREISRGDLSTNVAMLLAQRTGESPLLLANQIAAELLAYEDVMNVEVAGPGFVNLSMKDSFWHDILSHVLFQGTSFGCSESGKGKMVNIEYVSANPTGPMHIGHCRGAVVGDVLANILSFLGYDVTREYYVNDAGAQIEILARSLMLRYREALGEKIESIPSGFYPGEYLIPLGEALAKEFSSSLLMKSESEALALIKKRAVDSMMEVIRNDLALLGVHHDVFFYETTLHEDNQRAIRQSIDELSDAGHVYSGLLPPPKGGKNVNPEEEEEVGDSDSRERILFRSSAFGDDMDRSLVKADGAFTYFASDVAYLNHKISRGFGTTIFVLGADHAGYVPRLKALSSALGKGKHELNVLLCNLVQLSRNGQPVRMSKRGGEFITLRNAVEEVGRDAIRFMMLLRKNDVALDFDLAKVVEQSKDNPVFYVQYASARCHSVFRQFQEIFPCVDCSREALQKHSTLLIDKGEIALIRKLYEYPNLIDSIARNYEPHRLSFYLHDLASAFHSHWNRGIANSGLRFINVDRLELSQARLALVRAVCDVLTSGLSLMGVEAPTEMH